MGPGAWGWGLVSWGTANAVWGRGRATVEGLVGLGGVQLGCSRGPPGGFSQGAAVWRTVLLRGHGGLDNGRRPVGGRNRGGGVDRWGRERKKEGLCGGSQCHQGGLGSAPSLASCLSPFPNRRAVQGGPGVQEGREQVREEEAPRGMRSSW